MWGNVVDHLVLPADPGLYGDGLDYRGFQTVRLGTASKSLSLVTRWVKLCRCINANAIASLVKSPNSADRPAAYCTAARGLASGFGKNVMQ